MPAAGNNQQEASRDFFERFVQTRFFLEQQFVVFWLLQLFQVRISWITLLWERIGPLCQIGFGPVRK